MMPLTDDRSRLLAQLLERPAQAGCRQDPLRPVLASVLVGRQLGQGVLTATLALPAAAWQDLWRDYFPGPVPDLQDGPGETIVELDDIFQMLVQYRAGRQPSEGWLAHIVAYSCCGGRHLWQDLGLAGRWELSTLMALAFPELAALNAQDMKWKKFLYRHYCSREGIYVCPAPSCGECADHARCFAPEE